MGQGLLLSTKRRPLSLSRAGGRVSSCCTAAPAGREHRGQRDHGDRGTRRRTATVPATPIASTASENAEPPAQGRLHVAEIPAHMCPTGEVLPYCAGPDGKAAQPAPHRRGHPPESGGDLAMALAPGLGDQGGADDFHTVPAAQQGIFGDQHVGDGAGPADRAPGTAQLGPLGQPHLTPEIYILQGRRLASQLGQQHTPSDQVRFDSSLVNPYDEHSGAPASSGGAPSRPVQKVLARGLSARLRSCSR